MGILYTIISTGYRYSFMNRFGLNWFGVIVFSVVMGCNFAAKMIELTSETCSALGLILLESL